MVVLATVMVKILTCPVLLLPQVKPVAVITFVDELARITGTVLGR